MLVLVMGVWGCVSSSSIPADSGPVADGVVDVPGPPTDGPRDLVRDAAVDSGGGLCDPRSPRQQPVELLIGPTGLEQVLVDHIASATQSVHLMMYQLTRYAITDELIAAHGRGVEVQVLVDGEQAANDSARQKLQQAGVAVRDAPAQFTHAHAKVLLIDDSLAVVMSANMNTYSMTGERNYGVVNRDPQDLAQLEQIFARDWAGSGELDLSCSRLVVSPINSRQHLRELITGAKSTLDLAVMYISDNELRQAVIARAAAGVTVRVLLADPAWIDSNVETAAELVTAGIPVKYLTTLDLHAKLIVADGVALVGSQNLSWTSLEKNREVGVFVTAKPVVGAILSQFNKDWQSGTTP